jgi:hypothetical protein
VLLPRFILSSPTYKRMQPRPSQPRHAAAVKSRGLAPNDNACLEGGCAADLEHGFLRQPVRHREWERDRRVAPERVGVEERYLGRRAVPNVVKALERAAEAVMDGAVRPVSLTSMHGERTQEVCGA